VATGRHYPYTLPALSGDKRANMSPNADAIAHGHITLPMGPGYRKAEIDAVVKAFRHAAK